MIDRMLRGIAGAFILISLLLAYYISPLWLWFTGLFANFAEALAEGRGKAQAEALKKTRTTTQARK